MSRTEAAYYLGHSYEKVPDKRFASLLLQDDTIRNNNSVRKEIEVQLLCEPSLCKLELVEENIDVTTLKRLATNGHL